MLGGPLQHLRRWLTAHTLGCTAVTLGAQSACQPMQTFSPPVPYLVEFLGFHWPTTTWLAALRILTMTSGMLWTPSHSSPCKVRHQNLQQAASPGVLSKVRSCVLQATCWSVLFQQVLPLCRCWWVSHYRQTGSLVRRSNDVTDCCCSPPPTCDMHTDFSLSVSMSGQILLCCLYSLQHSLFGFLHASQSSVSSALHEMQAAFLRSFSLLALFKTSSWWDTTLLFGLRAACADVQLFCMANLHIRLASSAVCCCTGFPLSF